METPETTLSIHVQHAVWDGWTDTITESDNSNILTFSDYNNAVAFTFNSPNLAAAHGPYAVSCDYTRFASIIAGNSDDTFAFQGASTTSASINGDSGVDRFDYSGSTVGAFTLNLGSTTLPNVTGTCSSIEAHTGRAGDTAVCPAGGASVCLDSTIRSPQTIMLAGSIK